MIDGNTLSFGDQDGKMTLIRAAVNTDTNVIVEKKISIRITDNYLRRRWRRRWRRRRLLRTQLFGICR